MTLWVSVILVVVIVFASLLVVILVFGHFGRRTRGLQSFGLAVVDDKTEIDRLIKPLLDAHANCNGLALIKENMDAFIVRVLTARSAGRSLDLQYYAWNEDLIGQLLAREILHAVDRGVRVRLLLDDINVGINDRLCVDLDRHPNIEVRLFNPSSHTHADYFKRGLEMLSRAFSTTRRMHNKAWIADGRIGILGGRNIGNGYFDADKDTNYQDLDMVVIGSAPTDMVNIFDHYWNSVVSLPISTVRRPFLSSGQPLLRNRLKEVASSPSALFYLQEVKREQHKVLQILSEDRICWSSRFRVLADPPEKAFAQDSQDYLINKLMPIISNALKNLRIISPYFIPGGEGMKMFDKILNCGADVAILTNSLGSTDVIAVHGAYANYRRDLLKAGVRLFELKALSHKNKLRRVSIFGKRAALHSKAFWVDEVTGFVGSLNFDPRSRSLNTEMGILFEEPTLVSELQKLFISQTKSHFSYNLFLKKGSISWDDGVMERQSEPDVGIVRRIAAWIIGRLPIESQL